MANNTTAKRRRPVTTILPAASTHVSSSSRRRHRHRSASMKFSPPTRTHALAPAAHLPTTSLTLLNSADKYLSSSGPAHAKHGKARANDGELSIAETDQYVHAPTASSSMVPPDLAPFSCHSHRAGKRRRLSVSRYEDAWDCEEDVRLLNKAFRTAEDSLAVKDAQIIALRQELLHVQTSYQRKESELRQDLLFQHIMAQQRAARDHEKEKIGLHRLVAFLRVDHEKQSQTLKEQYRTELESERTRHQQALAQALKDKQLAVDRSNSAYLQVQSMHTVMEHANTVAKVLESDLDDLRRLDIEEAEQRERDQSGLPPPYHAILDTDEYIPPYGANQHRDNGTLELDNIEATITSNFMRELRAANRTSLALREHDERSRAIGAGSMLFHSAMLAFATACQHLRCLLENAIEGHSESNKSCGIVDENGASPREPGATTGTDMDPPFSAPTFKHPNLAELGLPAHLNATAASSDTGTIEHPIDLLRRAQINSSSSVREKPNLPESDAIIAVTDRISNTLFDLCTHVFAALDVREYCSERLCNNKCIRLGTWLRLADDTLLRCLKRRLEATAVEDVFSQAVDQSLTCTKCMSDHCGGYCLRLHMISYNITRLKSIRRTLDKISNPSRVGMYFNETMNWLRDNLEKERELSANAVSPPGQQATPVMTAEEMALAMQYSVLDATQAAAQRAIQREDPPEELARRLQPVRDLHFPGPRYRIVSPMAGPPAGFPPAARGIDSAVLAGNQPRSRQTGTDQSDDRIETFVNRAHIPHGLPNVSPTAWARTSSSLGRERNTAQASDETARAPISSVETRPQRQIGSGTPQDTRQSSPT
ncbi:hypothetical protein CERZMDRAFT_80162 [Cercospora zeae-maydis SCOH1-5]|uniref:Uncharacterized protein n=1 Tax=Cercospora zeae-maydis SCOH1-5 TaxID=717836 RepID=A0A6A6FV62_9PEZI|nr:hypothetical protein CERZMDRAFT_80162 [Cercospora zeae-maydis SCOH1-5]